MHKKLTPDEVKNKFRPGLISFGLFLVSIGIILLSAFLAEEFNGEKWIYLTVGSLIGYGIQYVNKYIIERLFNNSYCPICGKKLGVDWVGFSRLEVSCFSNDFKKEYRILRITHKPVGYD